MIYGNIADRDSYQHLLLSPTWKMAFDWLTSHANASTPLGVQKLQGEDVYVNVMTYDTVPIDQARYESHRRYVDLQYCISGGEVIDWRESKQLVPDGDYTSGNDLQFYRAAPTLTCVHLSPGTFGIFYPNDAHRPKIADGTNTTTFKAVFKIAYHLASTL